MNSHLLGTMVRILCAAILAFGIVLTTPSSGRLDGPESGKPQSWIQQPQRLAR